MNIRLEKKSLRYGVELPQNKLIAQSPIELAPLPEIVTIPLEENAGAASETLVKKGDKVLTGQKITDSDEFDSVPMHATVSGEVTSITTAINPSTGQAMKVIAITSDGEDKWVELQPRPNPEAISSEEILKAVREAGVVDADGITSPAHVKLSPPKDKKIDTVILNGYEWEPYVTSDHRVMLEYGEKVLSGLNIMKKVLSPVNVYVAIGDNKEDAMNSLEELIVKAGYDFKITPIKAGYPLGDEKTLIKTVVNREVLIGGLAADVGVVVHNVSTAKAIHEAIYEGKPYIERVVTVTGAVVNPKNLLVRFGTPVKNLIEYCGGITEEGSEVIIGGPMTGISQFDPDSPIFSDTNCVLVKVSQPIMDMDCISCGRCIEVCPMNLMPTLYPKYVKVGRYDECATAYIDICTECGVCAYTCPANIPIVQYVRVAKRELSKRMEKE